MSTQSAARAAALTTHNGSTDATDEERTLKKRKKLLSGANIKFTFPSGATYDGTFKDGRIDGYGVYTYAKTGDVYEGEWKADLKHGRGSYVFANGDKYVGQWYMGNKHGKGQFVFASGDEYVGSWKDNQMNGYGVFLLASSGDRYEGYWKDGVRQGEGSLYYGNSDLYEGEWASGHQQGLGVFCQSNNDLYCGTWNDGAMDGKGVLREKGIPFLVEYVGGYLIVKLKQCDAPDETEADWAVPYRHYLAWIANHESSNVARRSKKDEDLLHEQLLEAQVENSILRKRIEDILALHRTKGPSGDAAADEAAAQYWKDRTQRLEHKLKLLECTLAERVVEARKLSEALKGSEAKVQELDLKATAQKVRVQGSQKTTPHGVAPEPDSIDAEELKELREQNVLLAQMNEELQRKAAFLASDNAKLALKEEAAEDQYDKLMEQMSLLQATLDRERRAGKATRSPRQEAPGAVTFAPPLAQSEASGCTSPSAASEKSLGLAELQQRLVQANQLNVELQLKMSSIERQLVPKDTGASSAASAQEAALLEQENNKLRAMVTSLKTELTALQHATSDADHKAAVAHHRQMELEEAMKAVASRKAANPQLQESLEQKTERIARLEQENAQLARQLDEACVDMGHLSGLPARKKRRESTGTAPGDGGGEDMASVQKELKKLQRRLKKVTTERNGVAEQFYESQTRLARTDRALGALQGQVIVVAALSGNVPNARDTNDDAVKIDAADPSKLVLHDCGEETVHQYDFCFEKSASAEQVFTELSDPLAFVWSGYQFAIMTVGELRSGKTCLVRELLPLCMKHIFRAADGDAKHGFFSYTYRVAVVEVSARGSLDCASGGDITQVCYDSNGYVQPKNVRFVDCTSGSIPSVIDNLLAKRRQHHNGRSHTWIQLQCVRTSLAHQCQTVGRLTIFDWCGGGPLASQKTDIESARFANASNQILRDLSAALSGKLAAVPYTKSVESSLLFDLLGGNSVTAVLGQVRAASEHIEETLRTLQVLNALFGVRNGPLLPDNQTSDEIRWRGIVSAMSSDDQAEREQKPVDSIREF